jgi:hypothetical protein
MLGHLAPQGGPRVSKPKTGPSVTPQAATPPGNPKRPMNRGEQARAARDEATRAGKAARHANGGGSHMSMADMARGPRYQTAPAPALSQGQGGLFEVPLQIQRACMGLSSLQEAIEWGTRAGDAIAALQISGKLDEGLAKRLDAANSDLDKAMTAILAAKTLAPDSARVLCQAAFTVGEIAALTATSLDASAKAAVAAFMAFLAAQANKKPGMSTAKKLTIGLAVGAVGGGVTYWIWKRRRAKRRRK